MTQATKDAPRTPAPLAKARTRYEDDLYSWVNEQVALLRAGRLGEIDAQNIAEELSDVGKSEFGKLRSALWVLVINMLKWDQQPEHRTPSWVYAIREQRRRYADILRDNPGLKARRAEALRRAYPDARDWAADETNHPPGEFPATCPYPWEDLLDRPFEVEEARKRP